LRKRESSRWGIEPLTKKPMLAGSGCPVDMNHLSRKAYSCGAASATACTTADLRICLNV